MSNFERNNDFFQAINNGKTQQQANFEADMRERNRQVAAANSAVSPYTPTAAYHFQPSEPSAAGQTYYGSADVPTISGRGVFLFLFGATWTLETMVVGLAVYCAATDPSVRLPSMTSNDLRNLAVCCAVYLATSLLFTILLRGNANRTAIVVASALALVLFATSNVRLI